MSKTNGTIMILDRIKNFPSTADELKEDLGLNESYIRQVLGILSSAKVIRPEIERGSRKYRYHMTTAGKYCFE